MDSTACNYNMDATTDDGSCTVAAEGFDCDGACLSGTAVTMGGGSWISETSWSVTDCDGNVVASGSGEASSACMDLPDNYTITMADSYGDGWNGASVDFTVDGVTTVITFASGSDVSKTITVPASASSVGIAFTSGDWDSEVTYQVEWTNLSGGNSQTALSDGTSPAVGFKALNICQ